MNFPDLDLIVPDSLKEATDEEVRQKTDGCGPGKYGDYLIPDIVFFVSLKEACIIHDWEYAHAKTWTCKKDADMNFLINMLNINYYRSKSKIMRVIRDHVIFNYFVAVYYFGDPFFSPSNQDKGRR